MAVLIKNLGKIKKGKVLDVTWNIKEYHLELIKKNDLVSFSFNKTKTPYYSIKVTNFKTTIIIPEDGFWQIKVKEINISNQGKSTSSKLFVN